MILPVAIFGINLGDWQSQSQGDRTRSLFLKKTLTVSSNPPLSFGLRKSEEEDSSCRHFRYKLGRLATANLRETARKASFLRKL